MKIIISLILLSLACYGQEQVDAKEPFLGSWQVLSRVYWSLGDLSITEKELNFTNEGANPPRY